jgi:hypothetical protein
MGHKVELVTSNIKFMTKKPTQYPLIIRDLRDYMNSDDLLITLTFGKKSLTETLYVSGKWEGKNYSVTADINWRSGELKTTEMDVFELVKLLKTKNISEMTHKDFSGLELVETRDGDTSFYDLEWSEPLTEEEQDEAPSEWDMYNDGEIDDSWYEFDGGIDKLEIRVGDYVTEINE